MHCKLAYGSMPLLLLCIIFVMLGLTCLSDPRNIGVAWLAYPRRLNLVPAKFIEHGHGS